MTTPTHSRRPSRRVGVDRVDLIPGRPPHATDDGRIAVPLWLLNGGEHAGDAELPLSRAEAGALRDQLSGLLAEQGAE